MSSSQAYPARGCLSPGKKGPAQKASASTTPGIWALEKRLLNTGAVLRAWGQVPERQQALSPASKAEESVGRVCRERLRPVFMSLFSSRGEPIQLGSSQLLLPEWLRRVGLVGALIARSYICRSGEEPVCEPSFLLPSFPAALPGDFSTTAFQCLCSSLGYV